MTNRELLQKIPEHGELAILRTEEQRGNSFLDSQSDTSIPSQLLTHAFSWSASKDGAKFWCKVLDELRDKKL